MKLLLAPPLIMLCSVSFGAAVNGNFHEGFCELKRSLSAIIYVVLEFFARLVNFFRAIILEELFAAS